MKADIGAILKTLSCSLKSMTRRNKQLEKKLKDAVYNQAYYRKHRGKDRKFLDKKRKLLYYSMSERIRRLDKIVKVLPKDTLKTGNRVYVRLERNNYKRLVALLKTNHAQCGRPEPKDGRHRVRLFPMQIAKLKTLLRMPLKKKS